MLKYEIIHTLYNSLLVCLAVSYATTSSNKDLKLAVFKFDKSSDNDFDLLFYRKKKENI